MGWEKTRSGVVEKLRMSVDKVAETKISFELES
jgi:hypothetical protein